MVWVSYWRSHSRDWETAQLPCLWSLLKVLQLLPSPQSNVNVPRQKRTHGCSQAWEMWDTRWLKSWLECWAWRWVVNELKPGWWSGLSGVPQLPVVAPSPGPQAMGWQASQWMMPSWGVHWVSWRFDCYSGRHDKLKKWPYGASAWGTGVEGISHLTIVSTCQKEGGCTVLRYS